MSTEEEQRSHPATEPEQGETAITDFGTPSEHASEVVAQREVATFGVSPAIANAIEDAVGVRLMELPLNPEAVLRALRHKAGKPLEDA